MKMAAAARLTPNGVGAALAGDTNLKPVVQIVELRGVNVNGAGASRSERFRAVVSDGAATSSALFAAQLSDLARSGLLRRGAIVQLLEYVINDVGTRRFVSASASASPA